MHKHTYEEPAGVQIESQVQNFGFNVAHVIMQSLAKSPDDRQQSMVQLRDQLKSCLWQPPEPLVEPPPAPPPLPVSPLKSSERIRTIAQPLVVQTRSWFLTLFPIVLVVALLAGFVQIVRHAYQPPPANQAQGGQTGHRQGTHKQPSRHH